MSSGAWRAVCPAKINLGLRVLGRRDDGYHELDTVFQAIDLCDELMLEPAETVSLTCDDPRLPTDERNLVLRAARDLAAELGGRGRGARMHLRKRIPVEAGLGGGSSDAAGALLGLCALWQAAPPARALQRLAAGLGADVPFFLHGGRARGTGRGDRIERLADPPRLRLLLGVPPFGVSTKQVFEAYGRRLTPAGNDVSFGRPFGHKLQHRKDFETFVVAPNDLQPLVFGRWRELEAFHAAVLEQGAQHAALSGSGSTVFALFAPGSDRQGARGRLADGFPGWNVISACSVNWGARAERVR